MWFLHEMLRSESKKLEEKVRRQKCGVKEPCDMIPQHVVFFFKPFCFLSPLSLSTCTHTQIIYWVSVCVCVSSSVSHSYLRSIFWYQTHVGLVTFMVSIVWFIFVGKGEVLIFFLEKLNLNYIKKYKIKTLTILKFVSQFLWIFHQIIDDWLVNFVIFNITILKLHEPILKL